MRNSAYLLFLIFLLSIPSLKAQTGDLKIIKQIIVTKDFKKDGVIGLNVTYKYNFPALKEQPHNDTIQKRDEYKITTRLFVNDIALVPSYGFQDYTNDSTEFVIKTNFLIRERKTSKIDRSISSFIPYAAFQMPDTTEPMDISNLIIKAELIGSNFKKKYLLQSTEKRGVSFYKPATETFSVKIDSIVANPKNANGGPWDYSFLGKVAPDIGVDINLAGTSSWNKYFRNTCLFLLPQNYNTISFTITKDDDVTLLVQDIDVWVHDLIARIQLKTKGLKKGEWYYYDKAGGNVKACKISYRIE